MTVQILKIEQLEIVRLLFFENEKDNGFSCLGLFPNDCIAVTFIWIP